MARSTEAIKRAKAKYNEKVTKITVEFYPQEAELVQKLNEQPSKQGFIKELIRRYIEAEQNTKSAREIIHEERMKELARHSLFRERVAKKLADAEARAATKEVEEHLIRKDIR
jgi:hypothetical protein